MWHCRLCDEWLTHADPLLALLVWMAHHRTRHGEKT